MQMFYSIKHYIQQIDGKGNILSLINVESTLSVHYKNYGNNYYECCSIPVISRTERCTNLRRCCTIIGLHHLRGAYSAPQAYGFIIKSENTSPIY